MRKLFTLLSVIFAGILTANAVPPLATFESALSGGGAGADYSTDVVTDTYGNIYVADFFKGTATFNGVTLVGSPKGSGLNADNSLFVSKIDPSTKATVWNIYSNVGTVTPIALATTPNGDLIVTGTIRPVINTLAQTQTANIIDATGASTTFNGLYANTTNIVSSFVAKFNSAGAVQWVQEFNSGTAKDKLVSTTALAVDASGNVYVTGVFTNTIVIPEASPVTLTSTNTSQAGFIAKLDATTGTALWHKASSGGIVSETISSLTYGDDGYLYAAGIYRNATTPVAVTIGNQSFTPSSGYDIALIKFDTEGNLSYIQNRTSASDTRVRDIAQYGAKVYVAGSFKSDAAGIQFTTPLTSTTTAYLNGYIAAFNTADGTDSWQKAVLAPAIAEVDGITISNGNLFALGYEYNALGTSVAAADAVFGDGYILADATNKLGDMFLSVYNLSTGVTQEVHWAGKGASSESANSLTSYGSNLYLAGTSNSNPLTFENASTYVPTTGNGFDFVLQHYTTVATGINEIKTGDALFAYADKANHVIVVKQAANVVSARLVDITGRTLVSTLNVSNPLQISTSGIATGIYILQLTTSDGQVSSQRILVQ